jgi:putative ABC transport system ATP-binding protein
MLIDVQDLVKIYHLGEVKYPALRGVTLSIEQGEFVAIMGPSGSGKSTFMNIVGCLDRPTSGRYILEGVDVAGKGRDELASIRNTKIGFVFQGFNLLPRIKAWENVELPLLYGHDSSVRRRDRVWRALSEVGLAEKEQHYPSQMSGGEQQRVAIARALINEPAILLADEPTGNLDSRTSVEVMGVFRKLNERGMTIILVTHEHDIAVFAKRNISFRDGQVSQDELSPTERGGGS